MNLFNKYASVHGEKKNLTFKIRILPIFLSLLLSLGAAAPAFAAGNSSEKEEVIYINLYSDGSVKDVYAVNIFSGGNITDYGDYYSVELLNTSDKITQNGDLISFSSSADRVYCKGKMKRTVIPWNISIKYFIDGTEYSADEVAGKSGHLEIKFKVTRNESCSGPFFDNYALQAAFTLDTKKCRNITAPDATLANAGSKKQISYTMLPGKGIDTAITSDVTDFEMEAVSINGVPLSMNIEVEDYELTDRVTELIDAVSELDDGVSELLDGTSELKSGSDELQNGATELTGGASELLDGAQDLLDGASELYDGSAELDSGAQDILNGSAELKGGSAELCDGAQTLYETIRDVVVTAEKQLKSAMSDLVDGIKQIKNAFVDFVSGALYFKDSTEELYIGASEIDSGAQDLLDGATELKDGGNTLESGLNNANEGASELENGLSVLSGNSDNIRSGAYQVFVSLTLSAETELNNSLSAAGFDAVKLTPENYEEVLGELLNKLSDYSYEQAGLAESDVYNGIASLKSQLDSYRDFYIGLIDYTQGVDTASAGASELKNGMAELSDGASGLADGASELYIGCTELKNGTAELVSGTGELQSGASELYNGALGLQEGVNGIYDGASEINEGVSELADGSTELESGSMKVADGAGELSNGASALYDGAAKLKNGTADLRDGTAELYSGSAELYNGCTELCGGTAELYDGCAELCDGTAELFDGCTDLKNGTAEMRSETDGMDEEISDKIDEMIGNITGTDGETVSFVSEKSTNVDAVQFVIQTGRIEIEETVTADHEAEEQLTFWQKILRLFGLY